MRIQSIDFDGIIIIALLLEILYQLTANIKWRYACGLYLLGFIVLFALGVIWKKK